MPVSVSPDRARRATVSVYIVFTLAGLVLANWLARLPAVRDRLDLDPRSIGLILLFGSIGSMVALPLSGRLVEWVGTARAVFSGAVVCCTGILIVALAVQLRLAWLMAAGLFVFSVGVSSWDVAMNLEGTAVEQAIGRAIMPRFHAAFSAGTVAGAGLGALAEKIGLSVPWHLVLTVIVVVAATAYGTRGFLPETFVKESTHAEDAEPTAVDNRSAWTEPRTLLVGLMVLSAALTEGAANDWLNLAVVDGFHVPATVGAMSLALFLTAMTAMRLLGTGLLDRHGRVFVLRVCAVLALVGLALFGLAPNLWLALVGAVLWGMGAALGFPVGMSAASDDPARAPRRLSVVATIGYVAFLAGPPLLGLLAQHVGYRHALMAILVPAAISLLVSGIAKPLPGSSAH